MKLLLSLILLAIFALTSSAAARGPSALRNAAVARRQVSRAQVVDRASRTRPKRQEASPVVCNPNGGSRIRLRVSSPATDTPQYVAGPANIYYSDATLANAETFTLDIAGAVRSLTGKITCELRDGEGHQPDQYSLLWVGSQGWSGYELTRLVYTTYLPLASYLYTEQQMKSQTLTCSVSPTTRVLSCNSPLVPTGPVAFQVCTGNAPGILVGVDKQDFDCTVQILTAECVTSA